MKSIINKFIQKYSAFPDHPDELVFKATKDIDEGPYKDLYEIHIWQYWQKAKSLILKAVGEGEIAYMIKPSPTADLLFRRHPGEGKKYYRLNENTWDEIITGKTVDIYMGFPSKSEYCVIDIDYGDKVKWQDYKKFVAEVYDFISKRQEVKKVEIYHTGKRGFHLWVYPKSEDAIKV